MISWRWPVSDAPRTWSPGRQAQAAAALSVRRLWSRYWVYSSKSFTEQVLDGYAQHALPLSHVVMDMDWHTTNQWGGYVK